MSDQVVAPNIDVRVMSEALAALATLGDMPELDYVPNFDKVRARQSQRPLRRTTPCGRHPARPVMARHTPSRERRALCRRPRAPQVAFAVKLADAEFGEGDEIIRTGALCDLASPNLYLISHGQAEVKVDGAVGRAQCRAPFLLA